MTSDGANPNQPKKARKEETRPFAILDDGLLRVWPHLKDRHRKVLPMILRHYPNMHPSTQTIAKAAGCSKNTVLRVTDELHQLGILYKRQRTSSKGKNSSCEYTLEDLDQPPVRSAILAKVKSPKTWQQFSEQFKSSKQVSESVAVPHGMDRPGPTCNGPTAVPHGVDRNKTSMKRESKAHAAFGLSSNAGLLGKVDSTDSTELMDSSLEQTPNTDGASCHNSMDHGSAVSIQQSLQASMDSNCGSILDSNCATDEAFQSATHPKGDDSLPEEIQFSMLPEGVMASNQNSIPASMDSIDSAVAGDAAVQLPAEMDSTESIDSTDFTVEQSDTVADAASAIAADATANSSAATAAGGNDSVAADGSDTAAARSAAVDSAGQQTAAATTDSGDSAETAETEAAPANCRLTSLATARAEGANPPIRAHLSPSPSDSTAVRKPLPPQLAAIAQWAMGNRSAAAADAATPLQAFEAEMGLRNQQIQLEKQLQRLEPDLYSKFGRVLDEKAGIQGENRDLAILMCFHHGYTVEQLEELIAATKRRQNARNPAALILRRLIDGDTAAPPIPGYRAKDPVHQKVMKQFEDWCDHHQFQGGGRAKLIREHFQSLLELHTLGLEPSEQLLYFLGQYMITDDAPTGVKAKAALKHLGDYLQMLITGATLEQ